MERIPSAQPPPMSTHQGDLTDMHGMDFPMYAYKPRRGMKRGEESKETYKLPHRLIEKKRRDRINECIAQLKDLLPEHLKLTTLGHLEKAVVLELTLKHVKTLSTLLEQQQQKILALQSGMHIEQPLVSQEKSEEMFRSGFHMCAKEVVQYLASRESDVDFTPSHVINHLHTLAADVLQQSPKRPRSPISPPPEEIPTYSQHQPHKEAPASLPPKPSEGYGRVPVIQRAHAPASSEQSGSDTDTDSGYGGELEKNECSAPQRHPDYYSHEGKLIKRSMAERQSSSVKREDDEPRHKRARAESSEDELLSGAESSASSSSGYGSYMSVSPNHPPPPPHPLCMPFYLIPPSAAAYLPMLEKCWYPGTMPMLYAGMGGSATAVPSERPPPLVMSPRGGSPAPAVSQTSMDSPALLQALKQVPPLNLETKD
ncbi:class E basic helix-loop-helix protein 40-like [Dunckerocampus dactyliophorus]|uniref:class E basic helix-loop-helix protein 40-like n=1 Tax=Dunckerocampus dactyliophorus TaxID=161453 RepID=UPI0024072F45|nr:class E basic helix-loop-helix protein 40-like [Dunckerocampus dactyliophorus]